MDNSTRMVGQEWQRWATQLLNCHYAKGDYQHVPDKSQGDAGIEGYSTDGCVYQMYGPEGELTFAQRHTKLRDKMTRDIAKFIDDKDGKLSKLFGSTKIRRWILFVPSFDSREIAEHATKKTEEVLAAEVPYVEADDFKVVVLGEESFSEEKARLLRQAVADIDITTEPVGETDIDGWSKDEPNAYRAQQLAEKTAKMPTLAKVESRVAFERQVIKWWLKGQNVMQALRDYPDAWEAIRRAKSEQEEFLEGHCLVTNQEPYPLLKDSLSKIEETVKQEVAALASGSRRAVAHEAVADWLMRCPLDFPEVETDEQP